MSFSSTINSVRAFLSSNHMLVDEEWLSGCVEYLSEGNSYTDTEIKNLAKEQWLLNDLKDICPGSLPQNLKQQSKAVLNGRFVLQINAAVDIGTPAYQQYLKLQKVNMENIDATTKFDDKVPNHRMIKLYMTDGVQDVTGIEYKPMWNLSCDITPGCKVLIKGPIVCRRGMMLLTESSVELLGGEVQDIVVSNSLAGLLSTKLGLPITQESNSTRQKADISCPTIVPSSSVSVEPDPITRPIARVTSIQVATVDDDIDLAQIEAIEAQLVHGKASNSGTKANDDFKRTSELQFSCGITSHTDDSRTNFRDSNNDNPSKRSSDNFEFQPEKKLKLNTVDDYPDDNDLMFEDEDYLRELEEKFDEKEKSQFSTEPFVYIRQINELSASDKLGKVFKIKGQVMKLLSKLVVGKDGWSLKCTLVDGSGSIDAEFTCDVLTRVVGITPQEMTDIKKQMAKKPELKEKAVAALKKAKETLEVLYCIIELTMLEVPQITQLIPFDQTHLELLKRRQT